MGAATPLAGSVVARASDRIALTRTFTRARDRFVDDHALGRRSPADPPRSGPLAALPFAVSLEIAAEAARAGGAAVAEIRDAKASRWLALDRGTLDVSIAVETRGDALRVAIATPGEARAAFDAYVRPGPSADPVVDVQRDPAGVAPHAWTAGRF